MQGRLAARHTPGRLVAARRARARRPAGDRRRGARLARAAEHHRRPRPHVAVSSCTLELLASRTDVWSFLAEPYHLSDWWPGITGVEPDRRAFAPGARWKVLATKRNVLVGPRPVETM